MSEEQPVIAVIGQQLSTRSDLTTLLRSSEYDVRTVLSAGELELLLAGDCAVSIALVDPKDRALSGYEATRILKDRSPETQILFLSQRHNTKEALEAQSRGAFCYLSDPLELEELLFMIAKAVVVYELGVKNRDLRAAISITAEPTFIGQGVQAQRILKQVERVATVATTLLITGASGTGKTTLARLIHTKSPRHAHPFVSVSCAAIPRDLLEAELFGYERGAFTGAVARKIGSIELAHRGTLFLDEIGDLPLELQPKLLSFLQDRSLCRLGGNKQTPLDVRIIAATNRDLESMVQSKTFREDLFFRLNVVNIKMPSLNERREDLRLLSESFLGRLAAVRDEKRCTITKEGWKKMSEYHWPGNVRELENVLERASLFCVNSQSMLTISSSPHGPGHRPRSSTSAHPHSPSPSLREERSRNASSTLAETNSRLPPHSGSVSKRSTTRCALTGSRSPPLLLNSPRGCEEATATTPASNRGLPTVERCVPMNRAQRV